MKTKGQKMLMRFEYDFAKDGGAIGVIPLRAVSGNDLSGAKILNAYAVVEDALDSSGTPTVTFGYAADSDNYLANSYAALSVAGGLSVATAPNRAAIANEAPVVEVGVAALTAGKISLYLEVLL